MKPKPKILKKVEELSDQIADFVVDPKNPDNSLEITATPVPEEGYILLQINDVTFKKFLGSGGCSCNYDGEQILCHNDPSFTSYIWKKEDEKWQNYGACLFRNCRVRQYAEIFLDGLKRKEQEDEE